MDYFTLTHKDLTNRQDLQDAIPTPTSIVLVLVILFSLYMVRLFKKRKNDNEC